MEASIEVMYPGSLPNPPATLVCLPGMGRTGKMFKRKWFSDLGRCGVRVLVATYSYACLEDMNALGETTWKALDKFGVAQPLVLLGYSMGGFVMETMVHQRPRSVAALVFVSTSIPNLSTFASQIHNNVASSTTQYLKYLNPKPKAKAKPTKAITDEPETRLSPEDFRRETVAIIAYTISNHALLYIKDVHCPVLIIYGTNDTIIPHTATAELKNALGSVPVTEYAIDGASHFIFLEKSTQVENAISTWLKETFPTSSWSC
jgi:pimeloyl-ACP methyl ester carboxylesterase